MKERGECVERREGRGTREGRRIVRECKCEEHMEGRD